MQLDLTGKHALVCGGSEGIGRATAVELATLGAAVTLLARREGALRDTVASLPCPQSQTHGYLTVDMADTDALRARVGALAAATPVHILINNTGGPPGGPAHTADIGAYQDAFNKHVIAGQALVQTLLPGMRTAGWGRIVNVISTSVYEPIPNLGVSNTIRGAVASWAKTLSRELGGAGITVNNVLPGATNTQRLRSLIDAKAQKTGQHPDEIKAEMIHEVPMARFAEASEIANAIAFLASPAAAYITGINVPVDGGRTSCL